VTDSLYLAVVRRRIQRARLAKKLRQEDVAEQLGISLRSYQRYEGTGTDKAFNPYVLTLRRIALALGEDTGSITREPSESEKRSLETSEKPRRASRNAASQKK
jgi:transcriptional regulator with XRE-family HTH domain